MITLSVITKSGFHCNSKKTTYQFLIVFYSAPLNKIGTDIQSHKICSKVFFRSWPNISINLFDQEVLDLKEHFPFLKQSQENSLQCMFYYSFYCALRREPDHNKSEGHKLLHFTKRRLLLLSWHFVMWFSDKSIW
jgi:hypothetical protein